MDIVTRKLILATLETFKGLKSPFIFDIRHGCSLPRRRSQGNDRIASKSPFIFFPSWLCLVENSIADVMTIDQ